MKTLWNHPFMDWCSHQNLLKPAVLDYFLACLIYRWFLPRLITGEYVFVQQWRNNSQNCGVFCSQTMDFLKTTGFRFYPLFRHNNMCSTYTYSCRCFFPSSLGNLKLWIIESYGKSMAGWWFGTFFIFPLILGISSSQLTFIFFRGVALAHQPDGLLFIISWPCDDLPKNPNDPRVGIDGFMRWTRSVMPILIAELPAGFISHTVIQDVKGTKCIGPCIQLIFERSKYAVAWIIGLV